MAKSKATANSKNASKTKDTGTSDKQNQITKTAKKGKTLGANHASHGDGKRGK